MMSTKKLFSLLAVFAGLLAAVVAPGFVQANPGSEGLRGPGLTAHKWPDGPSSAKDIRTLIYRASRAGKRQESMTLGTAMINRGGIRIEGYNCAKGAYWLTFSENARNHVVGGKLCDGGKSFKRRPNYRATRYDALLDHIAELTFDELKIDGLRVGKPRVIFADGRNALLQFDRHGNRKHSIRAIRFVSSRLSIERY